MLPGSLFQHVHIAEMKIANTACWLLGFCFAFRSLLIKVPSLLLKAASGSRSEKGQECLMALQVLKAVCCVLFHILKLVTEFIFMAFGAKNLLYATVTREWKDTALMDNMGYGGMWHHSFVLCTVALTFISFSHLPLVMEKLQFKSGEYLLWPISLLRSSPEFFFT